MFIEFNGVMSMIVLPNAICALSKIVWFGWKEKSIMEVLSLLIIELNSIFVWASTFTLFWVYYNQASLTS